LGLFRQLFVFWHFLGFWPKTHKFAISVWWVVKGGGWYRWMQLFHEQVSIDFQSIWRSFAPPNWRKTASFYTFCPPYQQPAIFWVFAHRYSFEGLSEIRLRWFHLHWKADTESFPTSHHEPHFDIGKASICIQQVRGPFSGINMKYFCNFWTPKICFSQMCVRLFLSWENHVKSI